MQKNETGLLTPHTKINSKWLRDLNIRRGTVNFTEENTAGAKFRGLGLGLSEGFMTLNPKAREGSERNRMGPYGAETPLRSVSTYGGVTDRENCVCLKCVMRSMIHIFVNIDHGQVTHTSRPTVTFSAGVW